MSVVRHVEQEPAAAVGRSPLAFCRWTARLSQSELARRARISRQHLARLEEGKHRPTRRVAEALATQLDVAVDVIFPNYASSPGPDSPSSTKADSGGPDAG